MRTIRLSAAVSAAILLCGVNAQPSSVFAVASVKLDSSGAGRGLPRIDAMGMAWRGATLKRMICEAYQLQYAQVVGAPAWTDTERYEIEAKAGQPATPEQIREMLRNLLAERFGLKVRSDSKALPVYVLGVAKGGPKLREAKPDQQSAPAEAVINRFQRRATMAQFAALLSQMMSGPILNGYTGRMEARDEPPAMVVDQTELRGVYEINLDLSARQDGDFASTLVLAVGALGLKLDYKRMPVEVLTVLRAERIPTAN